MKAIFHASQSMAIPTSLQGPEMAFFKSDLADNNHSCPPYHSIMINRYIGEKRKLLKPEPTFVVRRNS